MTDTESIRFNYRSKRDWSPLTTLRLVNAVHFVQPFAIPRPKSLMGHANWQQILTHIELVREQMSSQRFKSIYLQAAGQESAVLQRLLAQLAEDVGLPQAEEGGDLLIRVRRNSRTRLWELLVRVTVRPLITRPWRVAHMPGALNGPLAALMVQLAQPEALPNMLNVMCGSGTLLAECGTVWPEVELYGCDINPLALEAAQQNLAAAGVEAGLQLADGGVLPYLTDQFACIVADMPWGQLIGSHKENKLLYPRVLAEMSRVLRPGGVCVLMTQETRHLEKLLHQDRSWTIVDTIALQRGNTHPHIYVLAHS